MNWQFAYYPNMESIYLDWAASAPINPDLPSFIADALLKAEQKDDRIWQLLFSTLEKRADVGRLCLKNRERVSVFFAWNLCNLLGYKPEMYNCAICAKKLLPSILFFSAEHGGVVCEKCVKQLSSNELVKEET